MGSKQIVIQDLMQDSGVKFGTSGARGLALDMTDEVCYAYTLGFLQYLEASGELSGSGAVGVGGDLRPSTERIMCAASQAIRDKGYRAVNCGRLPSPALAYYGLGKQIPAVMVTGSHIPDDRNGIKYTKKEGEILKHDEAGIKEQRIKVPAGLFDDSGAFCRKIELSPFTSEALDNYVARYLNFFPAGSLKGTYIGVYQHSAVGRDLMPRVLMGLGAEVKTLGYSDAFIPVDTEAIRAEDIQSARRWSQQHGFDAIVSTDGDSDRPLIGDEKGKWLRGDIAGILCGKYLKADAVATPVTSNSAVDACGYFEKVIRTRVGSPYVIEAMQQATKSSAKQVVGYEANGGFLIATDVKLGPNVLHALPTRDAFIVHLAILLLARANDQSISQLVACLPQRFTYSNRLKNFPTEISRQKIAQFNTGQTQADMTALEAIFGHLTGSIRSIDTTDGIRATFENDEVIHLRPSGNAPEFRCYTEAATEQRAVNLNQACLQIMQGWL